MPLEHFTRSPSPDIVYGLKKFRLLGLGFKRERLPPCNPVPDHPKHLELMRNYYHIVLIPACI